MRSKAFSSYVCMQLRRQILMGCLCMAWPAARWRPRNIKEPML